MVIQKRHCKDVDINIRHSISLNGNDRQKMRVLRNLLHQLQILRLECVANNDVMGAGIIQNCLVITLQRYDAVSTVEEVHSLVYRGERYRFCYDDIQPDMIAATYRFKNIIQLQRLKADLQIPDWFVNGADRCRYNGEELLQIVLERSALGKRLVDLQNKYHRHHASIGKAINFFCAWMQQHWGYLLHDNLEFWKPYLRVSREAIVTKLRDPQRVDYWP